MSRTHRLALLLAALPMLLGAGVVGAWWFLQADWLLMAGFAVIGLGFAVAVAVPVLLVVAWRRSGRTKPVASTLLVLGVLFCNGPAYVGAAIAVVVRTARFTVTLQNDADSAWSGLAFDGGGVQVALPPIPPRSSVQHHLWFRSDGELLLRHGDEVTSVAGYVTSGLGGTARLVRAADGRVRVESVGG